MSSEQPQRVLEFGPFSYDEPAGRLWRDGAPVPLTPKAFEALGLLLASPGHLVTREAFIAALWPDTVVEEGNLTSTIWMVRRALGEHEGWIETVPRRGYRFGGPIAPSRRMAVPERIHSPAAPATGPASPPPASRASLRWAASAAIAAAALAFVWAERGGPAPASPAATRPSRDIAVLSLRDLSPAADQHALVDGLTDALITELARNPALRVRARTTPLRAEGEPPAVDEVARVLGVDTLVMGTVQRSGTDVRVTAQVVDGPSGRHVWAEAFDGSLGDVLDLQRRIARGVARAAEAEPLAHAPARPIARDAQLHYMQGRERYYHGINADYPESARLLQTAIDSYRLAVRVQPDWAEPWAGIAQASHWRAEVEPAAMFTQARDAAVEAIRLDDRLAEGHGALGYVSAAYFNEPVLAEREFRRAIELDSTTRYRHGFAMLLTALGKGDEATAMFEEARRRDPLVPALAINAAWSLARFGHLDRADAAFAALLPVRPRTARSGAALVALLRHDARASVDAYGAMAAAGASDAHGGLACALAQAGRGPEAREALAAAQRAANDDIEQMFGLADAEACLGDTEAAIDALERGEAGHVPWLAMINVDPLLTPVRGAPRYRQLLTRLGIPAADQRLR